MELPRACAPAEMIILERGAQSRMLKITRKILLMRVRFMCVSLDHRISQPDKDKRRAHPIKGSPQDDLGNLWRNHRMKADGSHQPPIVHASREIVSGPTSWKQRGSRKPVSPCLKVKDCTLGWPARAMNDSPKLTGAFKMKANALYSWTVVCTLQGRNSGHRRRR